MIRASQADNPSAHVLRRAQTMEVERIGPTEFRVKPSEEGKVTRIVRFYPEYAAPFSKYDREGKYRKPGEYGPDEPPRLVGVDVDCYAEESKEGCGANSHRRYCSHVHAVITCLLEESAAEEGGESETSKEKFSNEPESKLSHTGDGADGDNPARASGRP